MFIMVGAWWLSASATQPNTVADRMARTLSEAGPSITLTSIASALSFAVGMMTNLNSVYYFCLYTAVAIMFNYINQVCFF
jgi:predicted RND superfamily exporter protein